MALVLTGNESELETLHKRVNQLRHDIVRLTEGIKDIVLKRDIVLSDLDGIHFQLGGMLGKESEDASSTDEEVSDEIPESYETQDDADISIGEIVTQDELEFGGWSGGSSAVTPSKNAISGKESVKHKPGSPKVTRKQALANLRRIVNERKSANESDRLDLREVNMIFGYNESTSGTFIKNAIKRGDLLSVRYKKGIKFYPYDVKAFINLYYDVKAEE